MNGERFCIDCEYRKVLAKVFDTHISEDDCDKANTCFCEKMRKETSDSGDK